MTNAMLPDISQVGDVSVIKVGDDHLDSSNSREFKARVMPLLASNSKVVIDMKSVNFVDSTGLGVIISCLKAASAAGGDLRICELTKPVRTLFELTRMYRVFQVHNTTDEALAALQA